MLSSRIKPTDFEARVNRDKVPGAQTETRFHERESGFGVRAGARRGGMNERFRSKNEKKFL